VIFWPSSYTLIDLSSYIFIQHLRRQKNDFDPLKVFLPINEDSFGTNNQFKNLPYNFVFVDLMSQVCPNGKECRVFTDAGNIITYDGSHLTPNGALFFASGLKSKGLIEEYLR
jgi:hypothetical protein